MNNPSASPLQPHVRAIKDWSANGLTNAQIVTKLREAHGITTSEASVRRAKRRDENAAPQGLGVGTKKDPALSVKGDEATAISPVTGVPMSIAELADLYKLDPEEWEPESPVASWWGDPANPKYQLKVKFNRKKPYSLPVPARVPGDYIAPRTSKQKPAGTSKLWVIAGDQQVPNHDADAHIALCGFLREVKPHAMVNTGDLLDFGDISKHRDSVEWGNTAQDCIDVGYAILRDYRQAHEDMRMVYMTGNHDARLYREMLDRAERLFGLRRAALPGEDTEANLLSLANLLRADELNIEVIDPGADYEQGQFEITPDFVVRHGSRTGKHAALKTIERTNHGAAIGHTHYQSHDFKVVWDADKTRRTLHAVETGCLCKVRGGLGYSVDPGWVAGFATAEVWDDGTVNVDLAQWDGESIVWRGQRFS